MSKRMRAAVVAAGCVVVLGSSAGVAATWQPARAETAACASAMNSQGDRCFSPTFSVDSGTYSITSDQPIGSIAYTDTYVYAGSRTDQDFDTLCANQACTYDQMEVMPSGAEFSSPRCLQAAGVWVPPPTNDLGVETCGGTYLTLQEFTISAGPGGACFYWRLRDSGQPGLFITAHADRGTLDVEPGSASGGQPGVDQCIYRTD